MARKITLTVLILVCAVVATGYLLMDGNSLADVKVSATSTRLPTTETITTIRNTNTPEPTSEPLPSFVNVGASVGQVDITMDFVVLPREVKVLPATARTIYGTTAKRIKPLGRVITAGAIVDGGKCTPTNGADYCDSIALGQGLLAGTFSQNAIRAYDEMGQRCGNGANEIILRPNSVRFSFNSCHTPRDGSCQAATVLNAVARKAGFSTHRSPHILTKYGYVPVFRMDGTLYNNGVSAGDKDTVVIWTPTESDLKIDPRKEVVGRFTWEVIEGKGIVVYAFLE